MKNVFLFASIALASGLLITNIYNSVVDAKSWGSNIPQSIQTARDYLKTVNAGTFFRVYAPINQILSLLVLILFWKSSPGIRLYLGIAFVLYVLTDVMTFAYFYPRNEILFKSAALTDIETIKKALTQWTQMNWVRSAIAFVGLVFSCLSLHKIYTLQ